MSGAEDNDMNEMPGADPIHLLTRMVEALEAHGLVQPSQVLVSHGCKVPVFRDCPKHPLIPPSRTGSWIGMAHCIPQPHRIDRNRLCGGASVKQGQTGDPWAWSCKRHP